MVFNMAGNLYESFAVCRSGRFVILVFNGQGICEGWVIAFLQALLKMNVQITTDDLIYRR
jgi:hypothetical protein